MGTSVTRSEISLCTQSFLWTLLWAPSCLPGSAQHPLPVPWDWPHAQPTSAVSLQVAGLPGPAAARCGHLPPGAGRPHPQLQGDPGRVSLRALARPS